MDATESCTFHVLFIDRCASVKERFQYAHLNPFRMIIIITFFKMEDIFHITITI